MALTTAAPTERLQQCSTKEEALQQFAKLPDDKAGQLSVLWQRQYHESLGIEQEFG